MTMQLMVERCESRLETLTEQKNGRGFTYIEGPMIMTNATNRNQRVYPKSIMEESVDRYITDYVKERRAIGELNHPDYPFADPARAALMVESLYWEGDNVMGKALILNNPDGERIKSLLEAGFNLGVSTRGLGKADANGIVARGFMLNAIDAVDRPSGQVCYVNQVSESVQWELNESTGQWYAVKLDETFDKLAAESKGKVNEAQFLSNLERFFSSLRTK